MTEGSDLILGITGQDGAYLAELLLSQGRPVFGTSRKPPDQPAPNLVRLGIADRVPVLECDTCDVVALGEIIASRNVRRLFILSGQSSVGASFKLPAETYRSIVTSTVGVLELARTRFPDLRIMHAGTSEVFGNQGKNRCNEQTIHKPRSPYAAAKSAAMTAVQVYREAYRLFACNGILFNHESPLRPESFVISKIVHTAARMASDSGAQLTLGNMNIARDWGWAPDYVSAMVRMLEMDAPDDYVIATGHTHTLADVLDRVGEYFGLPLAKLVIPSPTLLRPCDHQESYADPSKAHSRMRWQHQVGFDDLVRRLCAAAKSSLTLARQT
jgi:GDPmannose 4,6-dehydratase